MKYIRNFLVAICVVQVASNKGRDKKLGKGFATAYRLNPFNPLSYIVLFITAIVVAICFGIIGAFSEDIGFARNHFKWD